MRLHRQPSARRSIFSLAFVIWAMLGSVSVGSAQEPIVDLFGQARAVRKEDLRKSEQVGFNVVKTAFSDIPPEGGVLVGFDVQLGRFLDHEMIKAIRPIYATATGEITTNDFGAFGNKPSPKKKPEPTRAFRARAPHGFVVGSITIRSGLNIDAMKMTYVRIKGNALDPRNVASSDWIGSPNASRAEKTLGGDDAAIVGIFGNMDGRRLMALGIYQLPEAPAVVLNPAPLQRVEPPVVAKPKPEPAEKQEAQIEKQVAAAGPKEAPRAQGHDASAWLVVGIMACVSVVVLVGCWFVFGGKAANREAGKQRRREKSAPSNEPRLPAHLDDAPTSSGTAATATENAVTAKAPGGPAAIPAGAFSDKPVSVKPASNAAWVGDSLMDVPSIARVQPPYFYARAVYTFKRNCLYRVYVLPEMLLFMDAGPETNNQFTQGVAAAGAVSGGLLGAAMGHVIGSAIDSVRADSREARTRLLDVADTEELIQLSTEDAASFRAVPADLRDSRIDPTSAWHSTLFLGNKYVGLFSFRHAQRGEMTLEIPTENDMKTALAELPAVFGDQLTVNVMLDRHSWKYVAKS